MEPDLQIDGSRKCIVSTGWGHSPHSKRNSDDFKGSFPNHLT
jgi:hypothetical protein